MILTADGRDVQPGNVVYCYHNGKLKVGRVLAFADMKPCYIDVAVCYSTKEAAEAAERKLNDYH